MHDGRVLDVEKEQNYIQEKKKEGNNLPKPNVKGAKQIMYLLDAPAR
jgi:hypothetical protein